MRMVDLSARNHNKNKTKIIDAFRRLAAWGAIFFIIVIRIVGLFMHTWWILDCFFREFKMEVQCKAFSIYPNPEMFSAIWLTIISFTSLLLIIYASQLPDFPSFKSIISNLIFKKYFYKLCVITILAIIYDVLTIVGVGEIQEKIKFLYIAYMVEHITSLALMFTLNFVPNFVTKTANAPQCSLRAVVYRMTLIYSLENYILYVLGSIVAAYKLVSIPTCSSNQIEIECNISQNLTSTGGNIVCNDTISVFMLLFRMSILSLRYIVAEFFLTKYFNENKDVLDTPMKKIPTLQKERETDQGRDETVRKPE